MRGIKVANAAMGYGGKAILRHIDIMVEAGEILGVVGPNGVGKSTLVKAVSGVLPLLEGEVWLNGDRVHAMADAERARAISVVPQARSMPEAFSVLQVVLMGRTPYLGWIGKEGEEDHRVAQDALRRTGIEQLADRRVGELSGGEQQKVMIARALAQTPDVLLLDEPTAHLDLRHQDEVLELIHSLALQDGLAVLITLHDLNLVARFTHRVALLSDGGIFRMGIPKEVLLPEELAHVYGMKIHVTTHPIHGTPLVLS